MPDATIAIGDGRAHAPWQGKESQMDTGLQLGMCLASMQNRFQDMNQRLDFMAMRNSSSIPACASNSACMHGFTHSRSCHCLLSVEAASLIIGESGAQIWFVGHQILRTWIGSSAEGSGDEEEEESEEESEEATPPPMNKKREQAGPSIVPFEITNGCLYVHQRGPPPSLRYAQMHFLKENIPGKQKAQRQQAKKQAKKGESFSC